MQVGRLFVVVLMSTGFAACGLQWDVRPDPGDAGMPIDAGVDRADAADGAVADVAPGTDAEAGPDCAALLAPIGPRLTKARDCQLGQSGQCTTTVKDHCGCDVVVRLANDTPTTMYNDAVAAFVAAKCVDPQCGACPQLGLPNSWACLQTGPAPHCEP